MEFWKCMNWNKKEILLSCKILVFVIQKISGCGSYGIKNNSIHFCRKFQPLEERRFENCFMKLSNCKT